MSFRRKLFGYLLKSFLLNDSFGLATVTICFLIPAS
jgi:hypothetical protein